MCIVCRRSGKLAVSCVGLLDFSEDKGKGRAKAGRLRFECEILGERSRLMLWYHDMI